MEKYSMELPRTWLNESIFSNYYTIISIPIESRLQCIEVNLSVILKKFSFTNDMPKLSVLKIIIAIIENPWLLERKFQTSWKNETINIINLTKIMKIYIKISSGMKFREDHLISPLLLFLIVTLKNQRFCIIISRQIRKKYRTHCSSSKYFFQHRAI